jgi:hypothetical protein
MPGKIKSTAQQAFLAIHRPGVLHELSGGHVAKGLPYKVGKDGKGPFSHMYGKKKGT